MNACAGWDITLKAEGHEVDEVKAWANEFFKRWTFQKEAGEQTGYLHFQFRGSLIKKRRDTEIRKLIRDSGFVVGGRGVTPTNLTVFETGDNAYVLKTETRVDGPWSSEDVVTYIPIDMRFEPTWNAMQQCVLRVMDTKPNRRDINCIVDPVGNRGKSFLATWLFCHGMANYIPFFTEAKDLMRMVHGLPRRGAYFIDLPRALSHKAEHEIYGGIEQLKTGIIYEDRYKFKMEAIDPVHVFVFTNRQPNRELASRDRWKVKVMAGSHEPAGPVGPVTSN